MNKIYIFDIDGTLTPSRRPMTTDFENFFFINPIVLFGYKFSNVIK